MRARLAILIDFYRAPPALLYFVGLALLFWLLTDLGANFFLAGMALAFIAAGLPLRIHSQTGGLFALLEEERQITHRRLSQLEDQEPDEGSSAS